MNYDNAEQLEQAQIANARRQIARLQRFIARATVQSQQFDPELEAQELRLVQALRVAPRVSRVACQRQS